MTQNKRIALNTLASYGRSVISLGFNLFAARWALEALGQSDFGLFGVVGSVIVFVSFLNGAFSGCVGRFYAYSIGKGKTLPHAEGLDDLCRWFNTAMSIYVLIPALLVAIGYPVGVYAVEHWLNIPSGRTVACIWVLRFTVATSIVSMLSVPYAAMMGAYQLITEVVIFNLSKVFMLFGGSWWLLHAPGDRLIWYAAITFAATALMDLGIVLRARRLFPACRVVVSQFFLKDRFREFFAYTGFKFLGGLGYTIRAQGMAMFINIAFGPKVNAAFSVGNQLSAQSASFSASLNNAVAPAITTYEGAGERSHMRSLAFSSCKFGGLLVALFAVPLCIEVDYVLKLWLVDPPLHAGMLCTCMLGVFLLEHMTMGLMIGISAQPKIGRWQTYDAVAMLLAVPIAIGFFLVGLGVASIGLAYLSAAVIQVVGKVVFAQNLLGMSAFKWLRDVCIPMIALVAAVYFCGVFATSVFASSAIRFCLLSSASASVVVIGGVCFVFNQGERACVMERLKIRRAACRLS